MEPDFVRLAQGLMALHRGAADLGKVASALIDAVRLTLQQSQLAGDNGLVTSALRELTDNLSASQDRLKTLAAMSGTLGQLRQQGFVIGRMALLLKSSGCNFAVESARTVECQQAFGDFVPSLRQLANQVGALGENISDEAQRTQIEQELLIRAITSSLHELQQLAARSGAAVSAASEHIQSMMDSSARVVQQAEQRARAISRHSEDAAYFLQFGDIVRQKLEHVADALATGAKSDQTAEQLGALDRLIAIQSGQIDAIRLETLTARDQLASAFAGLAGETNHLVENISVLAQDEKSDSDTPDKSNRLKNLSADILQLQTLHARGHELGAQSQGTALRAAEASAKLASHLNEVSTLNFELRLQALNAIVKTARLGADGATLGVLSAHVHEVSQDSGHSVAEILQLLELLRNGTASLGQGSQLSQASTSAGDSPLERGLRDIASLHEKFRNTSEEAANLADRQKQSLADASGSLDFLSAFDARMTALIAELEIARTCLAPHVSSTGAKPAQEAELLVAYTMESEREVHRRVLGKTETGASVTAPVMSTVRTTRENISTPTPLASTPTSTASSAPASDPNDNVELF